MYKFYKVHIASKQSFKVKSLNPNAKCSVKLYQKSFKILPKNQFEPRK